MQAVILFLHLINGSTAQALSLTETDRDTLAPGIELIQYRTSSPTTDAWVAQIDLCGDGIRIDATRTPSSTETVGSWASDLDPVLAVNGDFYKTGPVRIYGDAAGGGVFWPSIQTGRDSSYSGEWYYGDFGWIAFLPDSVQFTHSGWTKNNAASLGVSGGWDPTTRNPDPPHDVMALVSGFPAVVIEGTPMTCSDPTASSCFPDRSDMRDRHPRTAMGLSADLETLYLAVVDGRSSRSSGMYGSELADFMGQIGAWQAFNLDGGGSSTLWSDRFGVVNNPSDGSSRAVANHLGVFYGPPTGTSTRPWHCASRPPCDVIGPGGGTLDEAGDCFYPFGPPVYLREVSGQGEGGSLVWTNQFSGSQAWNQAWWRFFFEEAGEYLVEWHGTNDYAVARNVPHRIRANGTEYVEIIDQSVGDGWHTIGTYTFAAGGDQGIQIQDHASGSVASNQHIIFDAIRLTRVGPWCGDGTCDDTESCFDCEADCPPAAEEVPGNGIDDDCNGEVDESDAPIETGTTEGTTTTDTTDDTDEPGGSSGTTDPDFVDEPDGVRVPEKGGCATVANRASGAWAAIFTIIAVGLRRRRSTSAS